MTAASARLTRAFSIILVGLLTASVLAFAGSSARAAEPLERVVVALDDDSAFALAVPNEHAVAVGDGPTGAVRVAPPAGSSPGTQFGVVQVLRAGDEPARDRYVGTVGSVIVRGLSTATTTFALPVGEYELFVDGSDRFTDARDAVWGWCGGGYDSSKAMRVRVSAGGTVDVPLPTLGGTMANASVMDGLGSPHTGAGIEVFASLERNGREELVPVATVAAHEYPAAARFDLLPDQPYTMAIRGLDGFPDVWLGDVPDAADAAVVRGSDLAAARLILPVTAELGVPVVRGVAAVGQELAAEHGTSPFGSYVPSLGIQAPRAQYSYQWMADGQPITGAVDSTLTVTSALTGTRLSFIVTAGGGGFLTTSATSLATPRVVSPGVPRVSGSMTAGSRMSVVPGSWAVGTSLRYQWLMNGFPLAGATSSALVVPSDSRGKGIDVLITATRSGYETVALQATRDSGASVIPLHPTSAIASEWPSHQEPGAIYGHVVNGNGSIGLRDVRIRIVSVGTGVQAAPAKTVHDGTTDMDGNFVVDGLAPGNYCVLVTPPAGSRLQPYDGDCTTDAGFHGMRVFAGAGTIAYTRLWPEAVLAGTVQGSGGKVKGALVTAYSQQRAADGTMYVRAVASSTTDAAGAYAIHGLPAGSYSLLFRGPSPLTHISQWWAGAGSPRTTAAIELGIDSSNWANASLGTYVPMGVPAVSGAVRVGGKVTASFAKTSGASYSYQWYANGSAIKGATKQTLTLTTGQRGKAIAVRVVAKKSAYVTTTRMSAATGKVLTTAVPRILGTARVGGRLSAAHGTWTSGTAFSYQWYANGKAIAGATHKSYVVSSAVKGKVITVKVTGRKAGYASYGRVSSGTHRVTR